MIGSAVYRSWFRMLAVASALFLIGWSAVHAAPQAELWPRWQDHDPDSTISVDHSKLAGFLSEYLVLDHPDGVIRARYADITGADRRTLQEYIALLESTPVSGLNRDEQIAFWTNLYNAVTLELILEHYPVSSIRDIRISGPLYNRHPWDAHLTAVEGVDLTLNDIEHRIMRPIWQDPRIHYAVNCASIGCPDLQPEPFTGENWDELYDRAARRYVNHPRGARFSGGRPTISSIYDWYVDDFGGSIEGVVEHMLRYAEPELAGELRAFADGGYRGRVRYEYDWKLNEP